MHEYYQVTRVNQNFYRINSPQEGTACDLIVGTKGAALIDTGFGIGDLPRAVASITKLPLTLFNSHCHCDHIGGNSQFTQPIHMGEEDIPTCPYTNSLVFRQIMMDGVKEKPEGFDSEDYLGRGFGHPVSCNEGEVFDLGGITLRVFNAAGHSVGSRVYYLEQYGFLFTGDNIGPTVLLFGYGAADRKTYIQTLDKLLKLPFQRIYGSHAMEPMTRENMQLCRQAAAEAVYETGEPFPNPIRDGADARICCLPGMTMKDEKKPGFAAIILSANS